MTSSNPTRPYNTDSDQPYDRVPVGSTTSSGLLARLDAEWHHLADSPATAAALRRWEALEPSLGQWPDLHRLRATVHDRHHPKQADQILAALIRLAAVTGHDDPLAARTVLQLLAPGAIRLANHQPDRHEAQDTVFAELAIGIRSYPWQRRPHHIAANLLLDCRQRLTRARRRTAPEQPAGLDLDHPAGAVAGPGTGGDITEVNDLLRWARHRGALTALHAWLLLASHIHDTPVPTLASWYGRSRTTLFAHRAQAEHRLRQLLNEPQPATTSPATPRNGAARGRPPAGQATRPATTS
jgi:hypothetical protein